MTSPATLSGVSVPSQSVEIAPSAPARVVVLASGTGTLLRSLLDAATGSRES
ncbi:Probable 5'-phosphoribosylglycinamide formyltransferase PurN [Mycobacteroides abscessus]|nr:Probable 5'-phosphoribosylglycinamide formyltransferase PurN [Mycobacteroides abscessus]